MNKAKLSSLVLDFDLYPRAEVDRQHCHYIRQALDAGVELPPLVIAKDSKRVIDGFHRYKVYEQAYGLDCAVDVIQKKYNTEAAMFLDAMRYNASHGQALTTYDRIHCITRAERNNIKLEDVASALNITTQKCEGLRKRTYAGITPAPKQGVESRTYGKPAPAPPPSTTNAGQPQTPNHRHAEPLKRSIQHMSGYSLTPEQVDANDKLSGMNQQFHVNQLIILIENDLLDIQDEQLMERLDKLRLLLDSIFIPA